MSYLTCTNCGQKAPDTATRCRHCGRAFGRAPERQEDRPARRLPVALLLAGAALILVVAYPLWPRLDVAPSTPAPAAPPETAVAAKPSAPPPTATAKAPAAAPVDTVRSPTPPPAPRAERPVPAAAESTRIETPVPSPVRDSIDVLHQRYARVFANLRAERTSGSPVLQVLQPGEVVSVDSLVEGWYRVTTAREIIGYVDQQFLDTLPPPVQ